MNVYAVVVTYRPGNWLVPCFRSLMNSELPVEIVAIDNASGDGTPEKIQEQFPAVKLIKSSKNLGFAKANNIGIEHAMAEGADFVFLLNQDAWIERDTIKELVGVFKDNSDFGILSPIHLNGDGSMLDYGFCNYISKPEDQGRLLYSDLLLGRDKKPIYQVNYVNAAAWLISKPCILKVGLFDDELFSHYGEDNNYLQRVGFEGLRVGVSPNCKIYHDREDRVGKWATSKFVNPSENQLRSFLIKGANPNFQNRFEWMRTQTRRNRVKALVSLILFRFKDAVHFYNLASKQDDCFEILKSRY